MPLKTVLFVEGTRQAPGTDWLTRTWNDLVCGEIGAPPFWKVVGISKAEIVGLSPEVRNLSSVSEPFDMHLARLYRREPFDSVVVAWDLIPKWNTHAKSCRWQETLEFYRQMATSEFVPDIFRTGLRDRSRELHARPAPSARSRPVRLGKGSILTVIMEPMFEILFAEERVVRKALGTTNQKRPAKWPKGWGNVQQNPDKSLIAPAIASAKSERPPLKIFKRIRGDYITAKDEWGYELLRTALTEQGSMPERAILDRLSEFFS